MILKALNIQKSYGKLPILKGIDLEVKRGEIVSIVGASGAGKSTLLHIIGTLDRPDTGSLFINNIDINSLNEKKLCEFRNSQIGFVFQSHNLLPEFSALENICIPSFIKGETKAYAEKKAFELLDILGIKERAHHKPNELSGGEQQRVSIARSLINNPSIILADEPSGNLDTENAATLHSLFFQLRDTMNQTFIIVTHNKELASISDRIIQIKDGTIID